MTKAAFVQAQQRWEHLCLTRRSVSYLMDDVNEEGQNGWELVNVLHYKDEKGVVAWTAFLKRPATRHSHKVSSDRKESSPEPTTQPENSRLPNQPNGFDLNGDEFTIYEELEEVEPEGGEEAKGE